MKHAEGFRKKSSRMNSLFSRLFASIMTITILILVIQVLVVAVMMDQQSKQFEQDVFVSYKNRLMELLSARDSSVDEFTLENIGLVLRKAADDRISGLILHDVDGKIVLSLGKTPRGIIIGDTPLLPTDSRNNIPLPEKSWYTKGTLSFEFAVADENSIAKGVVMPDYHVPPPPVQAQDIAGTIPLYKNTSKSELIGFVEVLVLGPMNYAMTAMLLRRMVSGFGITILIALIIALFGSRLIARTVSRHAVEIVKALGDVAQGRLEDNSYHSTMTELTMIAESVEALKRQLLGHERMRQQWIRGIAHDLNTPVTALKLSIESALDQVVPLDSQLLERMRKEYTELERRVAGVMTLAYMESPDFRMEHDSIDVLDFVDEVISSSLTDHKVLLNIKVDQISGDRRLLVLVARELINNAYKYGFEGIPIEWTVDYEESSSEFIMQFKNKGFLSKDTVSHVFEPWFRGDESRSQSGSGMGLAIVRQVMEAHGGLATIHTEKNTIIIILRWPK